jgi:hypothetical protein
VKRILFGVRILFMARVLFIVMVALSCLVGLTIPGRADTTESPCMKWDIKGRQEVNKPQAERLYLEAWHWVKEKFPGSGAVHGPCITVHVGAACPSPDVGHVCVSPVTGDLYVSKWRDDSPELIAQAAALTGMLHLVNRHDITKMSAQLLLEDRKEFLDVIPSTPPPGGMDHSPSNSLMEGR